MGSRSIILFESDRLVFRKWRPEDRKPFSTMNSDPLVMEFFPSILTEDESNVLVDRIEGWMGIRGYGLWAVETKRGNDFIGYIGFNYVTFESNFTPCVEIGWRLRKEEWGKGYATEGARRCLEYGFINLHFEEVYSFTSVKNIRSVNVMKKIGLNYVGTFLHPKLEHSSLLKEHALYRMKRDEFLSKSI